MIVVLALVVGVVFVLLAWRGTHSQATSVRIGGVGAALVLAGSLVIGSLLMVIDPGDNILITQAGFQELPSGERVVRGLVENQTNREMSPVRVALEFIDSESRVLDRAEVETAEVGPRGRWEFEVPIRIDSVAGFRGRVGSPDNVRPFWLGGGCGSAVCRPE